MSEKPTKPKKTITPEQRAKMDAGRKAAAEKRKKEKEELKARVKKEMEQEKKNMKKAVKEAEKQQKDRLNNAKKDNDAKKKIKKELEQLKESMKIETKKPVEFKKEEEEIKEVLEEIVEEVKEEVEEVIEEKKEEIKEEKTEEKPTKPTITKTQIEGLFQAKVSQALENINDETTKDIFRDTANNYDFNDSVENNINRLMRRAKEKFLSNTETIKAKKEEIEEKIKNDEYERVQLEKQKRLERMRAKYNKLMKSK
tara:strand:+ start:456 stop:1220 length:765 start_codon:yes stop_codon:yes gene_type:complete